MVGAGLDEMGPRPAVALELGADSWCMSCYPCLPGAGFKAGSVGAASRRWLEAFETERAWLAGRGVAPLSLRLPVNPEPGQVRVLETVRTPALTATGDSEAYFAFFGQPLTPELVEQGEAQLAAGRAAVLAWADARSPAWLDERTATGKRTPREVLHHLADAELFYLVRLLPEGQAARESWAAWSGRGMRETERLATVRNRLLAALHGLAEDRRAFLTVHDPHAERWTPMKVMWRAIWHERYTLRLLEE